MFPTLYLRISVETSLADTLLDGICDMHKKTFWCLRIFNFLLVDNAGKEVNIGSTLRLLHVAHDNVEGDSCSRTAGKVLVGLL